VLLAEADRVVRQGEASETRPRAPIETRSAPATKPARRVARSATLSVLPLRSPSMAPRSRGEKKPLDLEQQARVDKIRAQLEKKSGDGERTCLIHPIESRLLPWWDFCTTVALLFTATVTPWETAFVDVDGSTNPWTQPWFIINRIIDLIFLTDMILQFFIMYPLEQKTATSQIVYGKDPLIIARRYLKGWFAIDFGTLIPSALSMGTSLRDYSERREGGLPGTQQQDRVDLMFLRVLRAVRMVKLIRLVRVSKIYERWQARISLSFATVMVIKCIAAILLSAHWFAVSLQGLELWSSVRCLLY
jgi:hypothetical protein